METRSFKELEKEVNELYNQYKEQDLRELVSKSNGYIIVDSPNRNHIKYCKGTIWEHEIDILIPGKKTFEVGYRNLSKKIQRNDIKIVVTEDSTGGEAISYQKIIEDLYTKVNGDYDNYIWYKDFLTTIHWDGNLDSFKGIENFYVEDTGYKLPTLVSFFRWCGTQENINYPRGWGKDLSFARYFEAIYAGYKQNEDFLNLVCERVKKEGKPPELYENVIIRGESIDLYNGSLEDRRNDGDGKRCTINLCEECYIYEPLEEHTLCKYCEAAETQKTLAEEESGTKQYTQEEIEGLFFNCIYDIRTSVEDKIELNFQACKLEPISNDIDNSFNGTIIRVEVNKKIIDVNVSYGYIGDEPSEQSYISIILFVDEDEVGRRDIEFVNGEYEWNSNQSSYISITDAEFIFDEDDIEEFVNLINEEIESIIESASL